jgi:hypothetical protein
MKFPWFRISILLFWLIMTGWLIRFEAFPHLFTRNYQGYNSLFERGPFVLDTWMRIEFNKTPIGYTHTWVDTEIQEKEPIYTLRNQTVMNLKLLGKTTPINLWTGATLNDNYELIDFFTTFFSEENRTRIEGKRISPERFLVTFKTPGTTRKVKIAIPENTILYSPMTELALNELAIGNTVELNVLNPLTLKTGKTTIQAMGKEKMEYAGKQINTTMLKISYEGLEIHAWMDKNGRILRQETPFGMDMIACPAEKAIASIKNNRNLQDIAFKLSVPSSKSIVAPRSCSELVLEISGYSNQAKRLKTKRQNIISESANHITMKVYAQNKPKYTAGTEKAELQRFKDYLAASSAIQSDNPEIIAKAEAITKSCSNNYQKAKAILNWTYKNIAKEPTASLPSAVDILEQKKGDCNEHSYLFAALARAAEIPAKVNIGIVYSDTGSREQGAFYYHAWNSVFTDEWVEMDSTFGQVNVDATHILLGQGNMHKQMQILHLLGKLNIKIIDAKYNLQTQKKNPESTGEGSKND